MQLAHNAQLLQYIYLLLIRDCVACPLNTDAYLYIHTLNLPQKKLTYF